MSDLNICVLGAGVVGLTTALELQKTFKQARIEIVADKFNEDTTSYVAGGVFRPGTSFSGPTDEITRKWITDAYHHWDDIRCSRDASKVGVARISGYIFSSEHESIVRNHYIEDLVPIYRPATQEELTLCGGPEWKYGSFFTTLLTECTHYLPWALLQFTANGGLVQQRKISSFAELVENGVSYDIVVNCTGMGAKYLCNDHKVVPIRGQVIKVSAPWIKTLFYGDYDTYIIPGFTGITLGGCRQYDSYNTQIDKHDCESILERCIAMVPSLKDAQILDNKVGLRPHRDPVRVEKELWEIGGGRKLKIVHQYGHGGYGVTTAPGTAKHAVKLVQEFLMGNSKL